MEQLKNIVSPFLTEGTVTGITPLGNGLINDTYKVVTAEPGCPNYVLQRINHAIFQDVDLLQANIETVTGHIRRKLEAAGTPQVERRVLRFIPTAGGKTYHFDGTSYWRLMVFIENARTFEAVTPRYARFAGEAFGNFQTLLSDLPGPLGETIPGFHDMPLRLRQLQEAVQADAAGRVREVEALLEEIDRRAESMCLPERLHRQGLLPKRVCHCDTKVNNMLFSEEGEVLCVIDLDTVMPSFVFSDYGDFLRTGACTAPEDEPCLEKVAFNMDIFRAFTDGYLQGTRQFLTPIEREHLPLAAAMFPYMQAVRFLADYLNGDTYYKTRYPGHNLVRTKAQLQLLRSVESHTEEMRAYIARQG